MGGPVETYQGAARAALHFLSLFPTTVITLWTDESLPDTRYQIHSRPGNSIRAIGMGPFVRIGLKCIPPDEVGGCGFNT